MSSLSSPLTASTGSICSAVERASARVHLHSFAACARAGSSAADEWHISWTSRAEMAINRDAVKRALGSKTKAFVANNLRAIEEFLGPTVQGYSIEVERLEGPRGRVLELSFHEARTAWEKFFWAALGRHWIGGDLHLEAAVRRAEDDLLSLGNVLETVIVMGQLAATTEIGVKAMIEPLDPSITCPIVTSDIDDEKTLDPTEEVDLEHPRVMLPGPRVRTSGPEEVTVVEGIKGRPKF